MIREGFFWAESERFELSQRFPVDRLAICSITTLATLQRPPFFRRGTKVIIDSIFTKKIDALPKGDKSAWI